MEVLRTPDYNNSILNLITSILKKYKVDTPYQGQKKLEKYMQESYDNIVLIVLDGMGDHILKYHLPNGILHEHKIDTITSVFPSTTTAAMTTYYSGKPPICTAWIGWSQYFKEYGRTIDLLQQKDSYTEEDFECKEYSIFDMIGYETIYEQIEKTQNAKAYEIMPDYCAPKAQQTIYANTIQESTKEIVKLCHKKEKKFIMTYLDNPDSLLHKFGCTSKEVREWLQEAEQEIEIMCKKLQGSNTLLIISADHGHIDIKEKFDILDLTEFHEDFIMPPFLETRCISFFIKHERKQEFKNKFVSKFKNKYRLYTKQEFFDSHLLGTGPKHRKVDDFIGDFIAVAISDTIIKLNNYYAREQKETKDKKATHCGLTKKEMEVPLIVFNLNQ